ncbi:hypothetical protein ILYODFUR_006164 [Ilyodon furcidens]|uniref:Uncharacterized protein n=1 Tax=Ilyodon furcidens TaxID=33524 RepID=A0ABV0SIV0_9TELE
MIVIIKRGAPTDKHTHTVICNVAWRYEVYPVCGDLQGQILGCYKDNAGKTLNCSNIAALYLQCVNNAKQVSHSPCTEVGHQQDTGAAAPRSKRHKEKCRGPSPTNTAIPKGQTWEPVAQSLHQHPPARPPGTK